MDISKIDNGALQESFDLEVKKVIRNLGNPNVDEKKARGITIKLAFVPYGKGAASLDYKVSSSLAGQKAQRTKVLYGIDEDGQAVVAEIPKGVLPGQLQFVTPEERVEVDGQMVDKATGEILKSPIRIVAGGKQC